MRKAYIYTHTHTQSMKNKQQKQQLTKKRTIDIQQYNLYIYIICGKSS